MNNTALVLIDIQKDYFPGGNLPLENPEQAVSVAGRILEYFRNLGSPVIHIQHSMPVERSLPFLVKNTPGFDFHPTVAPEDGEIVIEKAFPNAFHGTDLDRQLKNLNVNQLVVCGMMTHMCVSSTSRVAFESGYEVTVLMDATATRDLDFQGQVIPAEQVRNAHLAALGSGVAKLTSVEDYLIKN